MSSRFKAKPEGAAIGKSVLFACDASASNTVARWVYEKGLDNEAHAWIYGRQTELVNRDYLAAFQ